MRILYVVTAAEFGGAPVHVLQLIGHMVKRGHTVGLVSSPEPRLLAAAKEVGAQCFPNRHFVRSINLPRDIRALAEVIRSVTKWQPDVIHAHSTKAGYAARIAGALVRKPVVFTAHGWAFTEGKKALERRVFAVAERIAARRTAKTICVSEHDRRLALRFRVGREDQLVTIHNGVDPARFTGVEDAALRRELGLEGKIVLTCVARLSPPKDPHTLLNGLRPLKADAHLLLVGDGELRESIEAFIFHHNFGDRVCLMGEREDIPELLAISDVFVLSSLWEGLPYTIIEAMMAGLPVVATSVGGVPELVEDGVTGFLVPPKNAAVLAEKIQVLLDNDGLRRDMGERGREKALREFTLDRMLAETEKLYREVLSEAIDSRRR